MDSNFYNTNNNSIHLPLELRSEKGKLITI